MSLLASIPSPNSGTLEVGPFTLHMYGLTLLAAIALCVWVTGRRWVSRGGDWDLIFRCAVWGVAAGIVGARLYHIATSWNEVPDEWWGVFAIWRGGLGVWGGIALGCLVGGIVAKRAGADVWLLADCLAPGLLIAQGIGRLGNWWNQELFGKPTDLPWGLEIDAPPFPYPPGTTFHPTFLYELVYDLALVGVLLLLDRRFRFKPPALFALYVAWYTFGRFFEELLRIDPSHHFLGLRLNAWVSLVVFLASTGFFVWWQILQPRRTRKRAAQAPSRPAMAVPRGRR